MRRVLVMPLGEASTTEVERLVRSRFDAAKLEWLDRRELRQQPARTLVKMLRTRYTDAVLVATDLRQRRLRLTSLVLGLVRAERHWRMDLRDCNQPFRLRQHVKHNAWPIVRHALACAVAAIAAEPLLRIVVMLARPRKIRGANRILYLRSQLWLGLEGGGSVAHTAGVIGGLLQAGTRVHVISSDRLPGVSAPTKIVVPETWFDGQLRELEELAYNVAFLGASLKEVHRFRPTALYQRHTTFNVVGAILARITNTPLVLEFNSSELWKGQYWGGLRRRRAAALVERINLQAASRVIVVSHVLRDQLVAQGVSPDKIVVNPNAVDPELFRPDVDGQAIRTRLEIPPNKIVVGFSGTFGMWHGVPTLAATISMVSRAHWLLIGDGPLRHLVERPGQSNVTLTGLVPHAEMPVYLAACDILVSPHGRQADGGEFFGSPTKLYEYMAMGRPILASAVGQIAEVLEDGRSALLVPPDDPEALCRSINQLIDDPELRARLGNNARSDAETRHTWLQNALRVTGCLEQ